MGRSGPRAASRYAPLATLVVVVLLALAVLPSALTLPQTNPATTLEYAPVPPSGERDPPPGGSFSSLGLATSGSLGAVVAGGDLPGGASGAAGVGKNPSTKRCVGNPPRQTEDPLSPPCVAYFQGDNFGATHAGVVRDEIRVVVYMDTGVWSHMSGRQEEFEQNGALFDLAAPPRDNEPIWVRTLRRYQAYFNDRYQTYNRFAHFWVKYNSGDTSEHRRADVADIYARVKPFVTVSYAWHTNEAPYLEASAQRGVLNFGSQLSRDDDFFRAYPGLIWSYLPSLQQQAKHYTSWVCRKLVPHAVSFSGNASDQGTPRRFGLLRTDNQAYSGMVKFGSIVKRSIEDCGGRIVADATVTAVGQTVNRSYPTSGTSAAANIASFRQAGVTTVLWVSSYETEHTKAAARANWYPEWAVAGDGALDGYNGMGPATQEQSAVDGRAWVVSPVSLVPELAERRCYHAYKEADPASTQQQASAACYFPFYDDLRQVFTGIQVAGPRLTPESIDKGFRAIPKVASTDPRVPACFYEPGDYSCVKDAVQMWWDRTSTAPGAGSPGCWRMPQGGRRHISTSWPAGDPMRDRSTGDRCNSYGGNFQL